MGEEGEGTTGEGVVPRYRHLQRALGADVFAAVQKSRVLLVGSGGIGVEILKNLVMSGFQDIELVDLDTIDVSNLNRQFLFRSRHVGQPKSVVAREAALRFNPAARIVAHHGNVKEERFGAKFFETFDLVLNALDNVGARQHVNRLCLATKLPLIDAGTQGYLGQTSVHVGGETACFDCEPKAENTRTFPICTIRSTPDKPVHCIVWAKELFKLMFGNAEESMLSGTEDDIGADEAAADAPAATTAVEAAADAPAADAPAATADAAAAASAPAEQQQEKLIRSQIVETVNDRPTGAQLDDAEALAAYARRVFDAVFDAEIRSKLQMRNGYKGAKKKPAPLSFAAAQARDGSSVEAAQGQGSLRDQRVMSVAECAAMFVDSVKELLGPGLRGSLGSMVFDKDDALTLRFVTAASNLRSECFGIERKSLWDTKGIAGNIIHAIATTNAIVAGLQTLEAIKLLAAMKGAQLALPAAQRDSDAAVGDVADAGAAAGEAPTSIAKRSAAVWVVRDPIGQGFLLQAVKLPGPNPKCYACGNAVVTLAADTTTFSLGDLVDKVLRARIGVNEPIVMLGTSEIYADGQGLDEEEAEFFRGNLGRALADCPAGGVRDGTLVDVEDFGQNLSFKILMQHRELDAEETPDGFILGGDTPVAKAADEEATAQPEAQNGAEEEHVAGDKRKAAPSGADSDGSKRSKTDDENEPVDVDAAVVVLD